MKFLLFLFLAFFISCEKYNNIEKVDLSEKEVKLTFFHTTDIHSKILPFQYIPNMWDKRLGMTAQDPQAHCDCAENFIPEGLNCVANTTPCGVSNSCAIYTSVGKTICDTKYNACRECLKDEDCGSGKTCINYQCSTQQSGVACSTSNTCSGHGECYNDNGSQYYGGIARLAFVLELERSKVQRSVYIDTGDLYQGAPIFNFFQGEPELRAMSYLNVDAQALGNHEFDEGVPNWVKQASNWVNYPLIAANYLFDDPYDYSNYQTPVLIMPYTIVSKDGLDIALIGIANTSSMVSISDAGNSLGITPEDVQGITQYFVDILKNQVDLVVIVSHGGLDVDQVLCRELTDIDIIFGGHHHVFTYPAQVIKNKQGDNCIVLHSGVDLRFLGILDVVAKDIDKEKPGMEIIAHTTRAIPFDNKIDELIKTTETIIGWGPEGYNGRVASIGEKKAMDQYSLLKDMLNDYEFEMKKLLNVDEIIGKSTDTLLRREISGASSPLGNLVSDAMMEREFIDVDFAITNTLGIRADLPKGDIKVQKIYEIFPFNNSVTTMSLSGVEVQELLDYVAHHSAERGCATQVQVSGISFTMNCRKGVAEDIIISGQPLNDFGVYSIATNDYMADGGSGFTMLARVPSKTNTGIEIRNLVMDYIRKKKEIKLSDFEDITRIVPSR